MRTQRTLAGSARRVLRSAGDFEAMWREMAQTKPEVWTIAAEPLPGFFSTWEPRLVLHEEDERYVLQAELPGMQHDDITVEYWDGILTIRGEQRLEAAVRGTEDRIKHGYRAFTRRFALAEAVDAEAMTVSYTPTGCAVSLPKTGVLAEPADPILAAS